MDQRSSSGGATGDTSRFVRQHEELTALGKELLAALDTRVLATDPTVARRALAVFSGRLRVHAAMEQEALYPRLLASADPAIAAKARALLDEVGPLYRTFFEHLAKWPDASAIQRDPEGFCRETMAILQQLRMRMKRENEELYPLVDGAASAGRQVADTRSRTA
ncbi:MAG: hemerythrin domain-containing protein [Polyangiaceae bacterium]|nr:hemerythrin domain-containing protein [Polyangiaceae bacterium]